LLIERIIRNERPTRLNSVETSDSGQTAGIARVVVRDAPRGDKKVNLQSSRALSARGHVLERGRLGVATSGGPLGHRTAIVLEFEQGKLLLAEIANPLPT
jgi:hypothetical protein